MDFGSITEIEKLALGGLGAITLTSLVFRVVIITLLVDVFEIVKQWRKQKGSLCDKGDK